MSNRPDAGSATRPSPGPHPPGAAAPARSILSLGAAAAFLSVGFFCLLGWAERGRVYETARRDAQATVRQLAEHADKVLSIHALTLRNVQWSYGILGWDRMQAEPVVHDWLRSLAEEAPEVQSYWLVDRNGDVRVNTFSWPVAPLNVSDRDYFQAQRDGAGEIHVGRPLVGRIRPDVFFTLSRPLRDAGGGFAGVAQVSILPGYFSAFYDSVAEGRAVSVMLARDDGTVLARTRLPGEQALPGVDMGSVAGLLAGAPDGAVFTAPSPLGGEEYLFSHVAVEGLPVQIVYGVATAELEAEWHRRLKALALPALIGLALLVPFAALAWRHARAAGLAQVRLALANAELERRIAERTAHLDRALSDLGTSRARLSRLLDTLPLAVLETDAGGTFTFVNRTGARMVDMPAEALLGRRYDDPAWGVTRPDGGPLAAHDLPVARALRGEVVTAFEHTIRHPVTGGRLVLSVNAGPLRDENGAVVGTSAAIEDVTERHRMAAALAESELRFRLAQEAAGVGTWEWDLGTGAVHWSDTYRRIWGHAPDEVPSYDAFLARIHAEDAAAVAAATAATGEGAGPLDVEFRIVRPDGAVRWISCRGDLMRDAVGRPVRMTGICRDVSDRREAEERQRLLMREVDHRAKNALSVALAVVRLSSAESVERLMEAIEGRVAALARAHGLLARTSWTGADLEGLVRQEMEAFAHGGRLRTEGPPVRLGPDAVQPLSLALHELATNAAKYGALSVPGGSVAVTWALRPEGLLLSWAEAGGPPVTPPETAGFGSTLLTSVVGTQLGGTVELDWRPEGLVCRIGLAPEHAPAAGAAAEPVSGT